jgi:hypothetical protein
VTDEAVRIQVRLKGVTGGERDPGKALLHGHCNMDGVRQELMYQTGAETRGAVAIQRPGQEDNARNEGRKMRERDGSRYLLKSAHP